MKVGCWLMIAKQIQKDVSSFHDAPNFPTTSGILALVTQKGFFRLRSQLLFLGTQKWVFSQIEEISRIITL